MTVPQVQNKFKRRLTPNEQETHHTSSTQTEAFDYLYRCVESLSVKDCPRNHASTQTEEFDYLFTESATRKCHFTQVCQHTKYWKPLLIMFHPLSNDEHISYYILRGGHGCDEIKTQCSTQETGVPLYSAMCTVLLLTNFFD